MLIWLIADRRRLKQELIEELEDPAVPVHFSIGSLWEIGIKHSLGRMPLEPDVVEAAAQSASLTLMNVVPDDCQSIAKLPRLHGDPFDRMLIAQASRAHLTLLTSDHSLATYGTMVRPI